MIDLRCGSCGKKYRVKDEYAGRSTKCNACGSPMSVPAPERAAPSRQEPGMLCPGCGAGLQNDAVLCVQCGYNLSTGSTTPVSVAPEPASPERANADPAQPSSAGDRARSLLASLKQMRPASIGFHVGCWILGPLVVYIGVSARTNQEHIEGYTLPWPEVMALAHDPDVAGREAFRSETFQALRRYIDDLSLAEGHDFGDTDLGFCLRVIAHHREGFYDKHGSTLRAYFLEHGTPPDQDPNSPVVLTVVFYVLLAACAVGFGIWMLFANVHPFVNWMLIPIGLLPGLFVISYVGVFGGSGYLAGRGIERVIGGRHASTAPAPALRHVPALLWCAVGGLAVVWLAVVIGYLTRQEVSDAAIAAVAIGLVNGLLALGIIYRSRVVYVLVFLFYGSALLTMPMQAQGNIVVLVVTALGILATLVPIAICTRSFFPRNR